MGIYIKNMKMPKNCRECFACKAELSPEKKVIYVCCFAKTDCPLVPVPEHGRLVDARYIDSENDRFFDMSQASEEFDEHASAYAYSLIANILANAPTIIPAEGMNDGSLY